MNAAYAHLYRYSIPFTEPVSVKGRKLLLREGLVIALKSSDGKLAAYGEIAPLPGLHCEPLAAAEQQTIEVLTGYGDNLDKALAGGNLFPSVRTGLEMALLNYQAAESGKLPPLSENSPAASVPLNTLLSGNLKTTVAQAETLYQEGYRTFKLKVNPASANEISSIIHELCHTCGKKIQLRLDANQSMTLDEAVSFCRSLPEGSISYIEEPLKNPEQIEDFHALTAIPAALDETLWQNPSLADFIPERCLKAYILKPGRLGGISAAMSFAATARNRKLMSVFSSAFESGISLSFYAWMAASSNTEPAACGLDTFRYLHHDLLEQPFGPKLARLDPQLLFWKGHNVDLHSIRLSSIWTL
ncbi:MAG: o-succinylbenzoate synthase [Chlorobium sp.]|uniref:o-succinylbenzoate synthase n=1 Tax=Chlorobium sp. TaxID=1095 RepID=UPI0025C07794|nr:o-succinylbenzoate synthase [Chlorobium sp.]MCF8216087.1 o-succinylbenzoate synthase [Chlorobium sp.]MCF8270988.1 o-succinylbenzoate synthase [Chlorobium sp.]MCF8287366.1 o-succinylbenzoate synthase [Chlorobium sp.]MCF8290901.1 o-succinylbenzoate synthase [Chlorobium sp.]MCF8384996.1 o-succinylbenzoate synthase [Chlorobium sp.]